MKLCDLCKAETDELITLSKEYVLLDTKEICKTCYDKVLELVNSLRRTYDEIFVKEKINLVKKLYLSIMEKIK